MVPALEQINVKYIICDTFLLSYTLDKVKYITIPTQFESHIVLRAPTIYVIFTLSYIHVQ